MRKKQEKKYNNFIEWFWFEKIDKNKTISAIDFKLSDIIEKTSGYEEPMWWYEIRTHRLFKLFLISFGILIGALVLSGLLKSSMPTPIEEVVPVTSKPISYPPVQTGIDALQNLVTIDALQNLVTDGNITVITVLIIAITLPIVLSVAWGRF